MSLQPTHTNPSPITMQEESYNHSHWSVRLRNCYVARSVLSRFIKGIMGSVVKIIYLFENAKLKFVFIASVTNGQAADNMCPD